MTTENHGCDTKHIGFVRPCLAEARAELLPEVTVEGRERLFLRVSDQNYADYG